MFKTEKRRQKTKIMCKGLCENEAGGAANYGSFTQSFGIKRCRVCDYWKKTNDINCYCCHLRYKYTSRTTSTFSKRIDRAIIIADKYKLKV